MKLGMLRYFRFSSSNNLSTLRLILFTFEEESMSSQKKSFMAFSNFFFALSVYLLHITYSHLFIIGKFSIFVLTVVKGALSNFLIHCTNSTFKMWFESARFIAVGSSVSRVASNLVRITSVNIYSSAI